MNLTNPPSIVEAELDDDRGSSLISLGEVTEVVKQLHSSKGPGVDEFRPEMLNAFGGVLADTSHQHCVEVWGSAKGVADQGGGSPV